MDGTVGEWTGLILFVLLALGVSFLCSILEAVLLSITPSYVASQEGKAGARLKTLKDDIDRPLAAILSLNTVAHTVGATGAGAMAAKIFDETLMGVFSGVLTLLILVFSEIIPKTLGATYWRKLGGAVSWLLPILIWMTLPLVWMSQGITKLIGGKGHADTMSREEFGAMANIGHAQGVFVDEEATILRNLLTFEALKARDVMTPRSVMRAAQQDRTLADIGDEGELLRFSRIPIYDRDLEDVTGYVLRYDVLLALAQDKHDMQLHELKRELFMAPHDSSLQQLFMRMTERQEHLALLVDEYGSTVGLVTMEDIVETLLGLEIVDEVDPTADMQELARKRWKERARKIGLISDGGGTAVVTGEADL